MVLIQLNIPDKEFNQLNNFYSNNFGYGIRTQLYNFIHNELEQCSEYDTGMVEKQPVPSILNQGTSKLYPYRLNVKYPDNSQMEIGTKTFTEAMEYLNEWSKYSFRKECRNKVFMKLNPGRLEHISKTRDQWEIKRKINGERTAFGTYNTIEEAVTVWKFLEKEGWDTKYSSNKIMENLNCNRYQVRDTILKLARGEMTYGTSRYFEQKD